MRASNYIGYVAGTGTMERFRADTEPTSASHGERYVFVIGPFRTARAARWAVKYGLGNPHFQHVDDAERISRLPEFANV